VFGHPLKKVKKQIHANCEFAFSMLKKNVFDELHTQTLKTYVELTECSQNRKGINEWMLELSDLGM